MTSGTVDLESATRARIVQALTPFVGRPVTSDLVDAMADALWELVPPKPVWIGVDLSGDALDDLKAAALQTVNFRDLFIGTFDPETPETILDEQWLAIMRRPGGTPPPVLVVMSKADYNWLAQVRKAANRSIDPHLWVNTYRGLPIQIDDTYTRPKVFTEAEARRQGRRW